MASRSNKRKAAKKQPSLLFYADVSDPDMHYFSRFNAIDPMLAFSIGKKKYGVTHVSEYGRLKKESAFDELILLNEVHDKAIEKFSKKSKNKLKQHHLIQILAEEYGIDSFRVGRRFPSGLLVELQAAGIKVDVETSPDLFPERQIKTPEEIKILQKANRASAIGFEVVSKTLSESKIRKGILHYQGTVLTSERLREMINIACLQAGASALHTIAAAGDDVVDNHCVGHGPIPANELIIVDIFPQRIEDGYWGDMTRTFLKGKASDAQRHLVNTVKRSHELSLKMIKPGAIGGKVHEAVEDLFESKGYKTTKTGTEPEGFFHALGHGVGLEVHENPIMRAGSTFRLKKNMVITTEPGLYYRGLGGCRIEDSLVVTADGNKKLSPAPYRWEIA